MRPVEWSYTYLLRVPIGISTVTSNSMTTLRSEPSFARDPAQRTSSIAGGRWSAEFDRGDPFGRRRASIARTRGAPPDRPAGSGSSGPDEAILLEDGSTGARGGS